MFPRRLLLAPAVGSLAILLLLAHSATAQSAGGTVTGRVVWGPCIRAIPLPMTPGAQVTPEEQVAPEAAPAVGGGQVQPGQPMFPQPVPFPPNGLPAGAVLVAVQNTSISARTDEAGKFSLSGVPAGQYLTVAAGPVANAASATAERPNVFVNGGQSVDLGTLSLGGAPTPFGIACRIFPGMGAAAGAETQTGLENTPPATEPQPAP